MGAIITGWTSIMFSRWRHALVTLACMLVSACGPSNTYAPVSDVSAYEAVIRAGAVRPYVANKAVTKQKRVVVSNDPVNRWSWPAIGTLLTSYTEKNKGIDIGGNLNMSVHASAPGRVVYAGGGLRGYGKLVIIKHNKRYLSVYAYNSRLLVHDGQWVKRGQKIAVMGRNGAGVAMLHFEIRRDGNPTNPLYLLK